MLTLQNSHHYHIIGKPIKDCGNMKIKIILTNESITFGEIIGSWLKSIQVLYSEMALIEKFRTPPTQSFHAYQIFKRRMKLK